VITISRQNSGINARAPLCCDKYSTNKEEHLVCALWLGNNEIVKRQIWLGVHGAEKTSSSPA
jgi:hypothetical protein